MPLEKKKTIKYREVLSLILFLGSQSVKKLSREKEKELSAVIMDGVAKLPPIMQQGITLRFGLKDGSKWSIKETAKGLGFLLPERIWTVEVQAIRRPRRPPLLKKKEFAKYD